MVDKSKLVGNKCADIPPNVGTNSNAGREGRNNPPSSNNPNYSNESRNSGAGYDPFKRPGAGQPGGTVSNRNENYDSRIQTPGGSAYKHSSGNIITNRELAFDFQSNILDTLDVVTYHWKLFITSMPDAISGDILNVSKQSVIAESAVTDITIDKVVFEGVAVPSIESGSGTQTRVKFELTEPAGAGLLDKMYAQALSLDIENWLVMPVFLQLTFKSRTVDSSSVVVDGSPGELSGTKWVWPLKLTRAAANVTHVGTRYDFEAIVYGELAQSNSNFKIQNNSVLRELDTVKSVMEELQIKLNRDQLEKLLDNYGIVDVYRIVVDPEIAKYKITLADDKRNSTRSNDFLDFEKKTATINAGTSIDSLIDTLLSHTEDYQKLFPDAPAPGREGIPMPAQINQMKKFWRVITDTRPLEYDKRRENYANEFTTYIIPYDMGGIPQNIFQQASGESTAATARKRVATYVQQDILKKIYNYIFTGLNDQIINFDLNLNFAFATQLARRGGGSVNGATSDKSIVNNTSIEDELKFVSQIRKLITNQNNATQSSPESITAEEELRKQLAASSSMSEERKRQLASVLTKQRPENRFNQSGSGDSSGIELESARLNARRLAKPLSENLPAFISDVNIGSSQYDGYLTSGRGKLWPVPAVDATQEKATGSMIEAASNSGISKVSSMFSLALHSGLDANLLNIKMTIKGDPFWLYPEALKGVSKLRRLSQMPDAEALEYLKNFHKKGGGIGSSVNTNSTDNFFVLRFRTPRLFNNQLSESLPENDNATVETFSGVYKVTRITSRFEGGKFVQELEALLDRDINFKDFSKEIDIIESKMGGVKDRAVLTFPNTGIPETAVKEPQILGAVTPSGSPKTLISAARSAGSIRDFGLG